ncbi:protease inhibitor I42 family protein [uncultured Brevundimonas sp.]|uniref:protease inhibitor I42 family protein n=1 Tax=uncultured Brevundimonas sp. TaxID=213418 RepID=UPI0030ED1FEA
MIRLALFVLILSLTACDRHSGPDFTPVEPPTPSGDVVHVRPYGDAERVEVVVGQTLALEMQSHFEWREAAAPTLLHRDDILWGPADRAGRDLATSGNTSWQVFVYRAMKPGEETLTLVEARPWEPDHILDRHVLTVQILADGEPPGR